MPSSMKHSSVMSLVWGLILLWPAQVWAGPLVVGSDDAIQRIDEQVDLPIDLPLPTQLDEPPRVE
jgi:hypothetical protein